MTYNYNTAVQDIQRRRGILEVFRSVHEAEILTTELVRNYLKDQVYALYDSSGLKLLKSTVNSYDDLTFLVEKLGFRVSRNPNMPAGLQSVYYRIPDSHPKLIVSDSLRLYDLKFVVSYAIACYILGITFSTFGRAYTSATVAEFLIHRTAESIIQEMKADALAALFISEEEEEYADKP